MALPDDAAQQLASRTAALINLLSRAAFASFWAAVQAGTPVQKAIEDAQAGFSGSFADKLALAFSELLRRSVGTAEVRAMPVGDFTLSRRLHQHSVQTQNEVVAIVRQHAQGIQQARELSLRLYDGYTPTDGIKRPLEGTARAELPKYLRWLTEDNTARRELTDIQIAGQEQVSRLKSQALRAGYNEAIELWTQGAAQDAVMRRLEVAQREKNRFFANRIAQTELARAHQTEVAAEFMADETIDAVKVVMNPMHPRTDICDMHARADLFGLGPGVYPKRKAPRPPFHPFCWCKLVSKPSLFGVPPREATGGEAAFLRSLPPEEAARVMGSRARAKAVLDGDSVQAVVNAGKDSPYRLVRLGDAAGHALVRAVESPAVTSSLKPTPRSPPASPSA